MTPSLRRALPTLTLLCCTCLIAPRAHADPLSKRFDIDFYRDVPSRSLQGLAARSDGRLVAGPVVTRLTGDLDADLLWSIEPSTEGRWLIGTGPSGKILEVTPDRATASFTATAFATLDETQILVLRRLPDGRVLAGTSPNGRLYLLADDGTVITQLALPVDSLLDLLVTDERTVLVATGNPGRIYRVDLGLLAEAGLSPDRITDEAELTAKGVTLFGEIRDRNVLRITVAGDRLIAGSAPRGNIYAFPLTGATETGPIILQENRDAEVTDLLALPNGDFYASFVFGGTTSEARLTRPATTTSSTERPTVTLPDPGTISRFSGRSTLLHFPANGFPETLASRSNTAFYRLALRGDVLLIAGGEEGELFGYRIPERRSINFAGSEAAQLNGLVPMDDTGNAFLLTGNNAPQLAVLDFNVTTTRSAETRRIDLGNPTELGNLRFNRLRAVTPGQISASLRVSNGTDEIEGWTPWNRADVRDDAWFAPNLRGRYVRVRIEVDAGSSADLQLDRASLYHLPENRRPLLQDFHLIAPGFGLIPRPEQPMPATVTLGQLVSASRSEGTSTESRSNLLSSQIVRQPGMQIVFWNVNDPDGDTLAATFSIRRDGEEVWTDLAVDTREPYVQFDFSHLADGLYFTRLVVSEQAPRPPEQRLTAIFETDDLLIDRTPPEILEATSTRADNRLIVTVRGRDALSLLAGVELVFNNGHRETIEQPLDGILDSREETFVVTVPDQRTAGASSVEILLYDAKGNSSARRLELR